MFEQRIEETVVEGKRLGRHIKHDERSLLYKVPVPEGITPQTVQWQRQIPVLDQGNVGSCTGNAAVGNLGTTPLYETLSVLITQGLQLNEAEALTVYSDAEKIDGGQGYPPEDNGSSGLSAAQACKQLNLISGYLHITDINSAHAAIQKGPFNIGSDWYTSFDSPDANGLVAIAPGATVRGGHEYECLGYNATTDLWECVNSWGLSYGVQGHFYYSTATFTKLLSDGGDATTYVAVNQPAPTPTPAPSPQPLPKPPPLVLQWLEDFLNWLKSL